jgi:hypothetical protein
MVTIWVPWILLLEFYRNFTCKLWRCNWRFKGLSDFVCLENVIYITEQEKVPIYYLSPFLGEFVRAKRIETYSSLYSFTIANQKSVRYSVSMSYFTNIAFQNVNKSFVYITDSTWSSNILLTYDVIDVNECFHDFMFVNRAPHPPPLR